MVLMFLIGIAFNWTKLFFFSPQNNTKNIYNIYSKIIKGGSYVPTYLVVEIAVDTRIYPAASGYYPATIPPLLITFLKC